MKPRISLPFLSFFLVSLLSTSCRTNYGPDIYKPDTSFKVVGYIGGGKNEQGGALS
jgi:hypothetical protein